MIEAERGEAIMTRGAVAQFGPLLSQMNVAGGGVPIVTQSMAMQSTSADLSQRRVSTKAPTLNVRDISRVEGYNTRPRNVAKF